MFIYNIKINGSKVFKIIFLGMLIIVIFILLVVGVKLFNGANLNKNNDSFIPKNKVCKITSNNYTNILKTVHDNIDQYVGVKVNFVGYVYRVLDLNENQFVLARDMIVSSDFKSVIVGFLCEMQNAKEWKDNAWVEITGEIFKGNYHGDMPIIKITKINSVQKPNDEYVYPPDENYIPTCNIF